MNTYILRVVAFASTRLGRVVVAGVCLIAILAVASTLLGPDINTEIKLNNYKKTDKLCLLRVFDTYVITNSVNGSKGIFIAPCDAILALKFSDIKISKTGLVCRVTFPPIFVSDVRVDREDSSFKSWYVSGGTRSTDPLRQAAMVEAERRMTQEALSERFVSAAQSRATNIIASLIRGGIDDDSNRLLFEWHWPENSFGDKATSNE